MAASKEDPVAAASIFSCPDDDKLAAALIKIAVLEERVANRDIERERQAQEYSRRLDDLNHAHEQAAKDKVQFLQRETYDRSEASMLIWRRDVDKSLTALSTRRASNIAVFSAVISILSIALLGASFFWRVP